MSPPASYACLPRPLITLGDYAVRSVQPQDIEDIRLWRNAQMDVLRQQAPLTPEDQRDYYAQHVWPVMSQAEPANILVTLLHNGQRIGYGGLVHLAWPHRRAEVSFLVSPDLASDPLPYSQAFDAFFRLMKILAFDDLQLHRLTGETYAFRTAHIALLEAAGFALEGRLRGHVRLNGEYIDSLLHACMATDAR